MPHCEHFSFEALQAHTNQPGLQGKIATHHMLLHRLVEQMEQPVVVEFGVDRGRSTCVFLNACEATGGHLYSLDIADCSSVAESSAWTFIQQSDQDVDALLARAPALQDGIDLLHIDSLHSRGHMRSLLMRWFAYVKAGGFITFHDVDPTPYLKGRRKDNPKHEPEAIGVSDVIREFFYANEDDLFLEYHFGSTGMGIMRKLSALGTQPNAPVPLVTRQTVLSLDGLFWSLRHHASRLVKRFR